MASKKHHRYRLDNSGIIHLAAHSKTHSNTFRLSATLKYAVNPSLLQKAFDLVTPRFPMLVAGIQNGFLYHYVVPVEFPPSILHDTKNLSYMSKKQIQTCAMHVLYGKHHIAVEFFHSLTDGYGGGIFLKSLLAEYIHLAYGTAFTETLDFILPGSPVKSEEIEDSFSKHTGKSKSSFPSVRSYQLKNNKKKDPQLHTTTITLNTKDVLFVSHYYKLTLTEFLTTLMADVIMEIQTKMENGKDLKPVQIMVPANLRKIFPSMTLRNFSLYALSGIQPEQKDLPFEELASLISKQLKQQLTKEHLSSMITINVRLEKNLCWIPLKLKCMLLHLFFRLFSSKKSCITISNLGNISLPDNLEPYIDKIDVLLTPRIDSGYNCGILSYKNQLHINITRNGTAPQLEQALLKQLYNMGFYPEVTEK